jgi:hypothetical protein
MARAGMAMAAVSMVMVGTVAMVAKKRMMAACRREEKGRGLLPPLPPSVAQPCSRLEVYSN